MQNNTQLKINDKIKKFEIKNIYIKDLSFESPNSPYIFYNKWTPILDFKLNINSNKIEKAIYEVTIHTKTIVKNNDSSAENKIISIIEIKQSGTFEIYNFNKNELDEVLSITAPEIIFPYTREIISNLIIKGGLPQIILPPINFNSLYFQNLNLNLKKNI